VRLVGVLKSLRFKGEVMIIGISGKARSGKDTFAGMLSGVLNKEAYPPYVMMGFANELKLRCQAAFDLSYEQLWGEDKEVPDKRYPKPKEFFEHAAIEATAGMEVGWYWTAREIMQNYGAFYRSIDNEFWIKNLYKVIEQKEYTNVVITDARYINEADFIIDRRGYVIRVERENKDDVHNMEHPSEIELDDYNRFDFTVVNNWGLEELTEASKDVVRFLRHSEKDLKKLKEIRING
jgi:hypothetical protein